MQEFMKQKCKHFYDLGYRSYNGKISRIHDGLWDGAELPDKATYKAFVELYNKTREDFEKARGNYVAYWKNDCDDLETFLLHGYIPGRLDNIEEKLLDSAKRGFWEFVDEMCWSTNSKEQELGRELRNLGFDGYVEKYGPITEPWTIGSVIYHKMLKENI